MFQYLLNCVCVCVNHTCCNAGVNNLQKCSILHECRSENILFLFPFGDEEKVCFCYIYVMCLWAQVDCKDIVIFYFPKEPN